MYSSRHSYQLFFSRHKKVIVFAVLALALLWLFIGASGGTYRTYELPDSLEFAGQAVPIGDAKTYERLDTAFQIYVHDQRGQINLWLKRLNKYGPYIRNILKEEGLHEDFMYLAVKESSLHPCPVSSAKAKGLWQFIPGTAERFGLQMNFVVDERCDLDRATRAASTYIKELLSDKYFHGDVFLAMAGYNAGENHITDMIRAQGNEEIGYFGSFMNAETFNYVPSIVVLKHILDNPTDYGFEYPSGYAPLSFVHYSGFLQKDVQIRELAKALDWDFLDFKNFHPHFLITANADNILPKDRLFNFYVPADKLEALKSYLGQP